MEMNTQPNVAGPPAPQFWTNEDSDGLSKPKVPNAMQACISLAKSYLPDMVEKVLGRTKTHFLETGSGSTTHFRKQEVGPQLISGKQEVGRRPTSKTGSGPTTHFRRTGSAFPSTSGNGSCPATINKWDNKDSKEPVSYTHLRAHETSLHLVCRLLLEKKKQ